MNKAKLEKYVEYGTTKIKLIYKEKKFKTHDCRLKYILEKSDSNDLIVVFSGIPRPGIKARYNYLRTLRNIKANKLFILDDFGYDQRGAYYLGKDKKFEVEKAVKKLIEKVKNDRNTEKTFYVGSSKGGYAALLFGIQDNKSKIISGSLQYLLGNYITHNDRRSENIMKWVMGKDYTTEDIVYLNNLLKETIESNKENECDLHLHYSNKEFTYADHMEHLLNDLNSFNIKYSEDVEGYENHGELAYYFPGYLVKKLNSYI